MDLSGVGLTLEQRGPGLLDAGVKLDSSTWAPSISSAGWSPILTDQVSLGLEFLVTAGAVM